MTHKIGIDIAMMEAAGSVKVQIVKSTRSNVISGLVILTTSTDLTIPVIPALMKKCQYLKGNETAAENKAMSSYTAPRLIATATPSLSRRRIETPIIICHGRKARTKSRIAE
jgi:hypothetical protein